jgi:hypothetical protein
MAEVLMFVMGTRPCNHFCTSHWQPGSYGVVDGLDPHHAQALPEIPIRIPNQDLQILARQSPFNTLSYESSPAGASNPASNKVTE